MSRLDRVYLNPTFKQQHQSSGSSGPGDRRLVRTVQPVVARGQEEGNGHRGLVGTCPYHAIELKFRSTRTQTQCVFVWRNKHQRST